MDSNLFITLTAGPDDDGKRLDRLLRTVLKDAPLSRIYSAIRKGDVLLDGKRAAQNARVKAGSLISIRRDLSNSIRKRKRHSSAAQLKPLDIVMENSHLLVLNKRPGIASHGRDSLTSSVRAYLDYKDNESLAFSPSPLHRLDKISSGLIVFSASIEGARWFTRQIRERRMDKYYLALLEGRLDKSALWRDNLERSFYGVSAGRGDREAVTHVTPLISNDDFSLVVCRIETGLTHQIRAQAAFRSHVLAGDRKYGSRVSHRPFLHAFFLQHDEGCDFFPREGLFAAPHDVSVRFLDFAVPGWQSAFYDFLSSVRRA